MKLKIFTLIIVALAMTACNTLENQSTSATRLQIVSLTGNDLQGKTGSTTVFSDVITNGSIINDSGVADILALTLDPMIEANQITPYMDVLIDQIDVEFRRTDGRNVEGVDVPYRFTQPMSITVPITKNAEIPFILIRHMAKQEAPLLRLRDNSEVLELVAVVTIHGKDLGGHRVAPVTGYVTVWCANFADSTTTATDTSR
jgi:hypothetical protein